MALPAAPLVSSGVEYTVFSTRRVYFVPTIANPAAPTSAELTAGNDLTPAVGAVAGFSTTTASLDLPRMGQTFTGNLPGRKTAADSSITFYLAQTGTDVRSLITESLVGYVVFFNEGIVTGNKMDVWPVRVGSVQVMQDLEAVAMAMIQFYIPRQPNIGVAIPTS